MSWGFGSSSADFALHFPLELYCPPAPPLPHPATGCPMDRLSFGSGIHLWSHWPPWEGRVMWLLDCGLGSSSRKSWVGAHRKPTQDRDLLAAWPHPTLDIISPFGSWQCTFCGSFSSGYFDGSFRGLLLLLVLEVLELSKALSLIIFLLLGPR